MEAMKRWDRWDGVGDDRPRMHTPDRPGAAGSESREPYTEFGLRIHDMRRAAVHERG